MLEILVIPDQPYNPETLVIPDQAYIPRPWSFPTKHTSLTKHIIWVVITDMAHNPGQPYIRVVITDST
jgi:hypothetical protein